MSASTMVLFDIETLGINDDSVILDASFVVYDLIRDKEKTIEEIANSTACRRFKLDVAAQRAMGRVVDPETVKWWMSLPAEARHAVIPNPAIDLTPQEFADQLGAFLKENGYDKRAGWIWQRGTMDIAAVDSLFTQLGIPGNARPLLWWKVRDLRTAIDLCGQSERMNGYQDGFKESLPTVFPGYVKHNSLHDVLGEIIQMRMAGVF